ncbi:MAG: ribosome small subunit-dependent GTPase A [Oscillospiraceae bacterium]|jgi:ribosome biogenesis GTPase|nr:ribosome small subunit-dependent GTPase A [Oscillospiraceae bacterium]
MLGTLIRGVGGMYTAVGDDGAEYTLRARGKLRHEHITPMAGDRVEMSPGSGEQHGWLERVLERSSVLTRPPVANLELLILTIAPTPEPDMLLIDRLMVMARLAGVDCLLCINKNDIDPSIGERVREEYMAARVPIETVSALKSDTLAGLYGAMVGKTCCFAGQSGVGKSTILSALIGRRLKIGEISARTERGKHTTRHSELLIENGLRVLDTPGFSLFALDGVQPQSLQEAYAEFEGLSASCRFQPCMHDREPGCVVRETMLACGAAARYERYRELLAETRQAWNDRYK